MSSSESISLTDSPDFLVAEKSGHPARFRLSGSIDGAQPTTLVEAVFTTQAALEASILRGKRYKTGTMVLDKDTGLLLGQVAPSGYIAAIGSGSVSLSLVGSLTSTSTTAALRADQGPAITTAIAAAVSDHAGAADPHPVYITAAELSAALAGLGGGSALPTAITPVTAIPLDGTKVFSADTTSSGTPLTIAAGQVEGGSCSLVIKGNGSAWGGITCAQKAGGSAAFATAAASVNHVLVWVEGGRVRYTVSQSDPIEQAAHPVIATAPALSLSSGTSNTLGAVYAVSNGSWSPAATSYTYLWSRSATGGAGTWAPISGATSSTYTLAAADVGNYVRATVQASNAYGTSAANASTDLGPILSAIAPLTSIFTASGVTQGGSGAYTITSSGLKGSSSVSAAGDFTLVADFTGNTATIAFGVAVSNTAGSWTAGFDYAVMDDVGGSRYSYIQNGTQTNPLASGGWVATAANRRGRVRRVGTTVYMEASSDAGATWTTFQTVTGVSGTLFPVIGSFTTGGSLRLSGQGFA